MEVAEATDMLAGIVALGMVVGVVWLWVGVVVDLVVGSDDE